MYTVRTRKKGGAGVMHVRTTSFVEWTFCGRKKKIHIISNEITKTSVLYCSSIDKSPLGRYYCENHFLRFEQIRHTI